MDYSKLRATALSQGEAEEAVTVDTRALIDKVLARYSGEWTTLRELIQNAADAQASTVKIKWETTPSTTVPLPAGAGTNSNALLRHTILHHTLRRLLVENDGQAFSSTDWARLKRIAEGNPDETKIGAFGVGFYSVFADCEEPFIRSGREAMAFYWKGNALFTRKMVLPDDALTTEQLDKTTFVLDYRNATTALPNLLSVCQFLATSLTFVALQRIEFWIDDWMILDLHKKLSPSAAVAMPRHLDARTKEGLMTVAGVDRFSAQIDAIYMHAVSWKPQTTTSGSGSTGGNASGTASSGNSSNSKSTDTYGMSSGDLPSLRSFFSRLTGSSSASAAQKEQRNKAAHEERLAQETLQQNLSSQGRASIFLRVTSAAVKTNVSSTFAAELARATKKPPPKVTKMAILTSTYDDVMAAEEATKVASITASTTAATATQKPASLPPTVPSQPAPPPYSPAIPQADIFASVLPSKKPGGRIFIGFPTMQTTGGGMHISAPSLIPTVEREAIDLNARYVRNWNMELLRVAGILTRLAFINEMEDLGTKFRQFVDVNRATAAGAGAVKNKNVVPIPTAAEVAKFVPEALHVLKTYTFNDSTPSSYVGQIVEEAFWTASKLPSLDVFSSRGVLSTTKVRMGSPEVSKFVDGIPVIVDQMKDNTFVKKLHDFGIIQEATMEDVKSELESKPLSRDQLIHFVKWIGNGALSGELDPPSVRQLLQVAVASVVEDDVASTKDVDTKGNTSGPNVSIIELRSIKTFLWANKIPASLPLPPSTIPYSITGAIPVPPLHALGWASLDFVPWMEYLINARATLGVEKDITVNPTFSAQVLLVLSKNWDNLSSAHKTTIIALLKQHTTMPTRTGMKKPDEAFFPSVKLFDDLPVVATNCQHLKDKFLQALGVRKTIDLDTIFTRLLSQPHAAATTASVGGPEKSTAAAPPAPAKKNWSHVELIKYLASVRGDIPSNDIAKLRKTAFCPAEAGPPGQECQVPSVKFYRPEQLFEPSAAVRELGFPILQWPDQTNNYYRKSNPEGQFLSSLGLRQYPSVTELLEKMVSQDHGLRDKARAYYTAHHQTHGYTSYPMYKTTMAILPVQDAVGNSNANNEKRPQETLLPPSALYTNPNAAILGFPILHTSLLPHASKFGVAADPPTGECVKRLLAKPPQSNDAAVVMFTYFSTRLADLHGNSLVALQNGAFVPVVRKTATNSAPTGFSNEKKASSSEPSGANVSVEHVKPGACYLGSSATYGNIFDFVDFGVNGNAFLFKCGSKSEPTKIEIARLACTEPARLLSTLQTTERYLALLRSLAEELPRLKNDSALYKQLQSSPFLLASREISRQKGQLPALRGSGAASKLFSSTQASAAHDNDENDDDDEPPIRQYQLSSARNISILDDYISYRLFKDKLMCAPEEDALEAFYLALGAQKLSNVVQEDIRIGMRSPNQDEATKLRSFVLERSKIFLYEYQKYRHDAIKHDIRWLEKHLAVELVQAVSLRRSLRSSVETHTEKRYAASARDSTGPGYTLYVASKARVDMYQVGQAVCQLVLSRPSQQAYFFFEPFLKLDLLDLRARGYNVDRILRAKAAEARIAEEERRKALEEEQERIRANEREWVERSQTERAQNAATAAAVATAARSDVQRADGKMPGAFDEEDDAALIHDSPGAEQERVRQQQTQMMQNAARKNKGLFSGLTRRLGLEKPEPTASATLSTTTAVAGEDSLSRQPVDSRAGGASQADGTPSTLSDEGKVTSPAAVQQNMLNAINATRPYGSESLYTPPTTNVVKEQATYCDSTHAHDLVMIAQAPRGMNVFLDRGATTPAAEFLAKNGSVVASFESLLRDVAAVYDLAPGVVQIYYDATGPTIAFNTSGSIFCNLRFFMQLHFHRMQVMGAVGKQARVDGTVWWWVVLAHELAHNLESSHNASHSYYTESFVQQYFQKMTARAATWGAPTVAAVGGNDDGDHSQRLIRAPPSYDQAMSVTVRPANLMD
ncbi:hypothetical protein SEPCBS57363_004913 [Sporothrix epigloea]|uniref:Sacsin/Nov domain-containing protein n=1 Tax=Sporothrix epigloea TaxID=1892477 RepID=A0ABP0DWT9_9PEZI